ncbi:hypothetical protein [Propionicicella superfundia]|uniref:galactose-binding domain-containing protein n=1 Tax=Propionicicella superfundia TaxID=348582 RepID=UPI0004294F8A|nr:hypothetical protein [Propionicicella superfundia]
MARGRWFAAGIVGVTVVVVASVVTYLATRDDGGSAPTSSDLAGSVTPVCGFSGELLSRLVANRAKDTESAPLTGFPVGDGGSGTLVGLAATADTVTTIRSLDGGGSRVAVYDGDGTLQRRYDIDVERDTSEAAHWNGRSAVAPDGSIYAIDSYQGRRALVRFDPSGSLQDSFPVPTSDESTGHPLDLQGVTWVDDLSGSPALLVGEGTRTVHAFRTDGTYLGTQDDLRTTVVGAVDGTSVAGLAPAADAVSLLTVTDATTGQVRLQAPTGTGDVALGQSATSRLEGLVSVLPGPSGDGFLLVDPAKGVEWVDSLGVRSGIWLNEQQEWSFAESANAVHVDGGYWFVVTQDGAERIVRVTEDEARDRLAEPVETTAGTLSALAQLGVGIGAVTSQPFNHFDAGRTPAAAIRFEDGWGRLGEDDAASGLEIRYSVSGDPTLADPVVQEQRTVAVAVGGGEASLTLPEARPGAYEVDVSLVDTASNSVLSGTCLRYSVGAEGADLDLGGLAEGADWGGPGPLRGVQLADRLGTGSHRVQLAFGDLVKDPTASPSAAGITWSALPGAGEGADGSVAAAFAGLRAAGEYAAANDVRLIVQVGSGGDAEQAAVTAGTWGGWVGVLVAEFARQAPEITSWSPWNEPNATLSSLTGAQVAERVDIPFARAAHAANADALVLAGNTLGFVTDWWSSAATTSLCSVVDAVAVHPYTGWNRSWEEEGFSESGKGFDELRTALGSDCADLPLWDTESGWWADGASAFWAQGSNVARKLLWYRQEGVAGWTYFFSEGGWGESNLSWSLIQHGSYVKPGGLTSAAVSHLLAGRETPTVETTGVPFSTTMRLAGSAGSDLLASWTSEARLDAVVVTDAPEVTVTDQYGATRTVAVEDGRAQVTLTTGPQFFAVADGRSLSIASPEEYGTDLLKGRPVTASSTHEEADAQIITSGTVNPYRPWRSGQAAGGGVDEHPSVEIPLAEATTIDRIAVASGSITCCEAGLRDYTVSVRTADGSWQTVATQTGQFWERVVVFRIDAVEASAVRIEVPWTTIRGTRMLAVNYTGMAGGLPTPFMGLQTESDYVVAIAAVSAWSARGG